LLGPDLDPGRGVHQDDRAVRHPQRRLDVAHEVGVTRRVEDVDLGLPPLERQDAGADGDVALDLVRVEVGHRVALFDLSEAGGRLRVEEHRLG
jgi:hypothetical protein